MIVRLCHAVGAVIVGNAGHVLLVRRQIPI